jgi:FliG N-terminal domain
MLTELVPRPTRCSPGCFPPLGPGPGRPVRPRVQAYGSLMSGGIDYAREVLERSVGPERAAEIAGRLTTVIEKRPFGFLRNTSPSGS